MLQKTKIAINNQERKKNYLHKFKFQISVESENTVCPLKKNLNL
jgi:hypothetical protein